MTDAQNIYTIPRANSPLIDTRGAPTREWYNFFLQYNPASSDVPDNENVAGLAYALGSPDGTVASIPKTQVQGKNSIQQFSYFPHVTLQLVNDVAMPGDVKYYGTDASGDRGYFAISDAFDDSANIVKTVSGTGITSFDLTDLADSGTGALLATTFDAKGRKTGSRAATITGTAGRVTVANGDASAGLPTIDLAALSDGGGGSLLRFVRDAWGRISGTSAATTSDLAEGSNLYFTAARVLASVLTGLSTATSAVITAADTVLSGFGKLQAQISAFGTMASQNANSVIITGGSINGTTIGAITPSTGAFSTLSSTSDATINNITVGLGPGAAGTNMVFGNGALAARTTAINSVAIGNGALSSNQTQNSNTAIGANALLSLTTGTGNLAIGASAGANSTNIASSLLIGSNAGIGAIGTSIVSAIGIGTSAIAAGGGTQPVAIGENSLRLLTTGQGNVAVGFRTGFAQTGGTGNTYIGFQAGTTGTSANSNVTGANNTYIGFNTGPGTSTQLSNSMALGNGAATTASNQIVLGNASVTDARVNGDWSVALAGRGLRVAEGSNCKQGVATLASGSVVVANTKVTATSHIILTGNADGGTPGWVRVSARTAGTSFTITSSSATDTSTIAYQIFEPA